MAVSGEFRYLGPAFSSVASVRPVKAMTRPLSLAIGNMIRLRNLEYMEGKPASGFRRRASRSGLDSRWSPQQPVPRRRTAADREPEVWRLTPEAGFLPSTKTIRSRAAALR